MSEPESGKRVNWAELYFDLVFVVAVTRVSAFIEHDHSWGGVLRAVIVFVPVYWLWVGMAIQTNQQDTAREILWAAAAVLDLSTPRIFRRRMAAMRLDAGHLAERSACSCSSRWTS